MQTLLSDDITTLDSANFLNEGAINASRQELA